MAHFDADIPPPDGLEDARRLIRELLATLGHQAHLNANLQHQLEQLLRRLYGKKSEKLDPDQLLLFAREILEEDTDTSETAPEAPAASPPRRPVNGHGRKPLPASLPCREVVHDLPPQERPCPGCGEIRRPIGRGGRERLEYAPAALIVPRYVRPKYACAACRCNVVEAQRVPEPIEKGLPGVGLPVHVAISKFADHLPLYRQGGSSSGSASSFRDRRCAAGWPPLPACSGPRSRP